MHNSFEEIAIRVNDLLRQYDCSTPAVDPFSIAKKLKLKVIYDDLSADGISGLLAIKGDESVIALNDGDGERRQNFTVAHEIGHYCLHHSAEGLFVDSKKEATIYYRKENSKREEVEANCFAAYLLMPKFMIEQQLITMGLTNVDLEGDEVDALSEIFKVSSSAMTYRLQNLELIPR